ncbi:TonB-dependent receptor (plasmid) [Polymorphobacter sp. PAMC 29334]|uniref:TonB-dependent receptor n=1 Tax=Polymorphobacter sp. PAMC 29334 TaxID=2862331 RepID=UPI001C76FBE6|nr:TonB-dependent receptor [Polymorphobacter sp. PAMC 29334]QYE32994.1 TonB-dependent receptor [Polymorphobacter sp. PAMC 29334]
MKTAQAIKRNSTQVVDSIAAEDIGKLPDNTVSDALQRVTGIQVTRASGEATSVQLRGLPDIESYINGREIFTGTGRGVALQDIPAELVAGVDVYKTSTPDQIEGAIAGSIDIRLRRPFDLPGLQVAGGGRAIYGDQAKKWSYIGSGLVSNHWTSKSGQEFGVLIGASYNRRKYEDQTAFNFGFNTLTSAATGNVPLLIPDTVGGQVTDGDRKRIGGNVSLQWKPTPNLEIYADGLFTGYRNDFDTDFFVGLPKAGDVVSTTAQPGSVGSETGVGVASTITTRNNFTISSEQTFKQKTDGYQGNVGARWHLGAATVSTEFTYDYSKVLSQQFVLDTAYVVPQINYNFNAGRTPSLNFNGFDYTNPAVLNLNTLFDNANEATSKHYAWRGDVNYDIGSGFLRNFKVGARYSDRSGNSAGTNGTGFPLGFLPGSQFPGFSKNSANSIIDGRLGVDDFALASSSFIRNNIGELRTIAGLPLTGHAFDPAQSFSLKERVYAVYGEVGYGFDVGSVPISGVFGVRAVNTVTGLQAVQVNTDNTGATSLSPINGHRNDLDLLPSFTLKAQLLDNVVGRVVAGKSILRPQFAQLNPATSLTQLGITGGAFGSGSGGNANLSPVKSNNLDLTLEWYFSNTGSITVGGFYKRLDNYIQTYASEETFNNSVGLPQTYLVARPRNAGKGTLKGIEAGYQQFFDFLPGPLAGFGAQANFTLADGKVAAPPTATGASGGDQAITSTSKYSYNLVAIYEKYGFSARLAYNWRSKYVDSYSTSYAGGRIVVSPLKYLDFSASYAVTEAITLTVDATNLLKETYHDNFGTTSYEPRDTRQYDRTFGAGVRVRF